MTQEFATQFAQAWIDAWNTHDLDQIVAHYSEDFTIETPLALQLIPDSLGFIIGKENIRAYWKIGLEKNPTLKFELVSVFKGINSLTICYINTITGKNAAETMIFNEAQKVVKAIVNYA